MYVLLRTILCIGIFSVAYITPIYAKDINQYVTVTPPDNWVKPHPVPERDHNFSVAQDMTYIMVDEQAYFTTNGKEEYNNYVQILHSPREVEKSSNLEIVFNPDYETIKIHKINLIRNGKVLDRIDIDDFELYRYETDRNKLIFNGELALSYIIPDVRVGDILDYAYTRSGKNPQIIPHISTYFQHQYGVPVQKIYQKAIVHKDISVNTKSFRNSPKPEISETENAIIYEWELANIEPIITDSDTPIWYVDYPRTYLSSFSKWSEVGSFFAPYYLVNNPQIDEINNIALEIQKNAKSDKDKVLAALRYVQKNIRYLSVEIGYGGYVPRSPEKVLWRKYGDCKDKTLLLINILNALEIEALPLLVNTRKLEKIDLFAPSYGSFDHVITYVKLNGQEYFIDPTISEQLGNLDASQQSTYQKGVIISKDSPGLININPKVPEYLIQHFDRYDMKSDPETVFLTTTSTYYMGEADYYYGWYKDDGIKAIEKSYIEYYQDTFPTIEAVKTSEIKVYPDESKVSIINYYKIPNAWKHKNNEKTFIAYPEDLYSYIPKFVGTKRKTPFKITYPRSVKYTITMSFDDNWSFDDEEKSYNLAAYDYSKTSKFKDNILTETHTYSSKDDHIKPENFIKSMKTYKDIRNDLKLSVYEKTEDSPAKTIKETISKKWDQDFININIFWILILAMMGLIFYNNSNHKNKR